VNERRVFYPVRLSRLQVTISRGSKRDGALRLFFLPLDRYRQRISLSADYTFEL